MTNSVEAWLKTHNPNVITMYSFQYFVSFQVPKYVFGCILLNVPQTPKFPEHQLCHKAGL
jgi:hypothetical protein